MANLGVFFPVLMLSVGMASAEAGTVEVSGDFMTDLAGTLDVVERLSETRRGYYDVTNNMNATLWAFGVTNNDTFAWLTEEGGDITESSCRGGSGCYEARTLTSENWNDIAFSEVSEGPSDEPRGFKFSFLFGDFETALAGDNTLNWFRSTDGAIGPGGSETGWFGFLGLRPESRILGIAQDSGGQLVPFFAGEAATPGIDQPAVVPLPAAGWMTLLGLSMLGFLGRRRRVQG